jgi:hypothetical protein
VNSEHDDFKPISGSGDSRAQAHNPMPDKIGYATDLNGEGTSVASTAIGRRWGIAKKANVLAWIGVGSSGSISVSYLLESLQAFVTNVSQRQSPKKSVVVIPVNIVYDDDVLPIVNAIQKIINNGFLVVMPVGMYNTNDKKYLSGRIPGVITVGFTDRVNLGGINIYQGSGDIPPPPVAGEPDSSQYDTMSQNTNYGPSVTILAPGASSEVASISINDTSMTVTKGSSAIAAGYVAGVLATIMSENNLDLEPEKVKAILEKNAFKNTINVQKCQNGADNQCALTANILASNLCNVDIRVT